MNWRFLPYFVYILKLVFGNQVVQEGSYSHFLSCYISFWLIILVKWFAIRIYAHKSLDAYCDKS